MVSTPPVHGGRLREAAQRFGIALDDWLDLSTGINPQPYPVPPIPPEVWQRLPEDDDGLEAAAARYYGSNALLPVAGTQAAILALPEVLAGDRVAILTPGYSEHAWAWRVRNAQPCALDVLEAAIAQSNIVVVCNPNNPCGMRLAPARLTDWYRKLAARGGWLIVDEAFIDVTPEDSLVPQTGAPGLIVLRSPGKFFGLAGARGGFVFAPAELRARLAEHLGPWAVSGPARHALRVALSDRAWQEATRARLADGAAQLAALLSSRGFQPQGTALFQRVLTPHAELLAERLAEQGVLVRRFTEPAALRFGLPANESGLTRLAAALDHALSGIPR
jgi:cobalamin biosynthesis protein CobC